MGSKIVKKYGYKFVVDGQEKEVDESRFNDYGGIESYKEDFPNASVRMTSVSGKQANIPLSKYDDAVKAGFALSKWEKNDTINEPSENDFAEYFIDDSLTEEQKSINNADTTDAPAMTIDQIEQAVGEADGDVDTTATTEAYPNIPVYAPNREAYKRNLEAFKAKNSMSADDMWASAEDEELRERLNRFDSDNSAATHTPLRVEDKDANLQSVRDIVDRNKAVNDIYSDVNKKMLEYGQRDMLGKDRAVQSGVEFNPETKQFQPKYVDATGGETFNKEEAKATSRAAEEIVRTQNVNDAMAYHFENDDELMSEIDKRIADIEAQGKEYTERRKAAKGQENSSLFERFISSAKDVDNRNKGTHVLPEVALSEDLNDPEFRNLITQKILLQQAKKRMEASKRKDEGFWGEFTEGGADALVNPETLGGSTFTPIIGSELAKVSKKWERGEKLTEDEQNLVIVAGLLNEAQSKDAALGYDIGDMLGQVLPFIAEVAMNPAQGSSKAITKGVFKGLMRRYGATAIGNKLATNIGKRLTTGALRAAGDIGQASALAGTLQAPKVIGGAGKRMAGTAEYSMGADGELKAKGFTKKEGALEALGKSFATMAIENYTELLGEQFGALAKGFKYLGGKVGKGANKVLPKALTNVAKQTAKKGGEFMRDAAHLLRLDYINAFIKSQGLNKWINANEAFEKQIAFNGLAGEILEEEIAIPLNALLVGDEKIENLADYEHQMQILLGTALMTGGMAALRTPSFVYGKRKASKDYNKATLAAERAIGKEEWEALRDRIDLADNDVLGDEVATIANNSAYNKEQKAAIVNYAEALQKQRGYNLFGDVKQKRGQWDSLYDEGYEAEGDNMGVVVSQLAEARAKVGEVFAIAEDGKLNDPIAYMAKYGGKQGRKLADAIEHDEDLSNEEKAMLLDYAKAEYRYNAMMEGIEDRVDSQLEEDAKAFDDITNKDTGTVMKVLVKGKDGVQFYAKSGNIIYDNTTRAIDGSKTQMANGSPMVVLYDPQARKSIAVSVYDLEMVVENVNADRLKVSMFESRRDALMAAEMQLVDGYATEARASILDRRTQEQKADEANSGYGDNSGNSEAISDRRVEEQKVVEATGVAERGGKAVDVEDVIAVYNFSKSDAVAARKQPEAYADIITDLEVDRQNAIAWSEGRQGAEQPDNWEYWKEREGLSEPVISDRRTEEQITPETKEQKAVEAEGAVDVQGIVAEWNAKTGEKVQVANSVEEVANAEARVAIKQGVKVKGWYDTRTGEVVVYAPNIKSAEDLVLTIVHENVSHKGLRDTLGEDIYNKMCDKTWEMMDEATRAKYESYAGVNNIKDETERHRAAADEYIASIAEKVEKEQKLTESERSIWSEVLKAIKEFIVKLYGDVKLTEQDIASIIRVSYDRMRARGDIEANSVNSGAEAKATETAPVVEAPKAENKVRKPRAKSRPVDAKKEISRRLEEEWNDAPGDVKSTIESIANTDEVIDVEDVVYATLAELRSPKTRHKLILQGDGVIKGVTEELGLPAKELQKALGVNAFATRANGGISLQKMAENIVADLDRNITGASNIDVADVRDMLIEAIQSAGEPADISYHRARRRIDVAEKVYADWKRNELELEAEYEREADAERAAEEFWLTEQEKAYESMEINYLDNTFADELAERERIINEQNRISNERINERGLGSNRLLRSQQTDTSGRVEEGSERQGIQEEVGDVVSRIQNAEAQGREAHSVAEREIRAEEVDFGKERTRLNTRLEEIDSRLTDTRVVDQLQADIDKAIAIYGGAENIPKELYNDLLSRSNAIREETEEFYREKYEIEEQLRVLDKNEKTAIKEAEREAKLAEIEKKYSGFLSGKSRVEQGRVDKVLSKPIRYNGVAMTKGQMIEALIDEGVRFEPSSINGKKIYIARTDDNSYHEITKTEYEYARHLGGKTLTQEEAAKVEQKLRYETLRKKYPGLISVKGDLDRRIAWLERALKGGNPNNTAGKKMQAELAELRELKDLSEGEARFSVEEERNLVGLHNLTEANLAHAAKMGGLANPSMAVMNRDIATLDNFGDITLIASKALIDKQSGKNAGTWGADAYSPRYPRVEYRLSDKASKELRERGESAGLDSYDISSLEQEIESNGKRYLVGDRKIQKLFDAEGKNGESISEYVDRFYDGLEITERLFKGYTWDGRRRYAKHTLENVSRMMKAEGRAGAEGNFGMGSVRATLTPIFKNIAQIKKAKGRIVSHEEFEKAKESLESRFYELTNLVSTSKFDFAAADRLGEAMLSRNPKEYLKQEYDIEITDEDSQKIKTLAADLSVMPTEYFETKFERPVMLEEFAKAVIPNDATAKTRQILADAGLEVVEYDPNVKGDRLRAVREASERDGIRFSVDEDESIKPIGKSANDDGARFRFSESEEDDYSGEGGVRFAVVEDEELINRLDADEKVIGYRNVVLNEDGTFESPMANSLRSTDRKAKEKTGGFELNKWERSEERPHLVDENGKITLVKPDGKAVEKVDYNPYIHNRLNMVNKQFKQAWERPNLVYIKTEIPLSDLESGYHAEKAKLPVGEHKWNGGNLILSRYDKPVEICDWNDVADDWQASFKKKGINFDIIPPALLPILEERGMKILRPHKNMGDACNKAYADWAEARGIDTKGFWAEVAKETEEAEHAKAKKKAKKEVKKKAEGGVRFRFIGEQGAKSMDKKEGTTARMDNLTVAKKMLSEYSYKEVKMATGWEKGMDGKWRYETPDFEKFDINGNLKFVQRHPDYARYRELVKKNHKAMLLNQDPLTEAEQAELDKLKAKWGGMYGKMDNVDTLDAYVQDDDLFKAYPELKSIRVKLTDELPKGTRGRFVRREADDILILDPEEIQGTIYLNSRYPLREVESTLIHEIQHAIQHIEGFAKGGNSEMINEEEQRKYEGAVEFTKERIESHRQLIHEYLEQQGEISDKMNDWYNRHGDEAEFDAEMRALDEKWDAIDKKIDGVRKRIKEDEQWLEDHNKQDFRLGYDGYRALAGEVEARNVQKRRGMTAEERRNSLAEDTEDVKRGQQIVVGAKIPSAINDSEVRFKVGVDEEQTRVMNSKQKAVGVSYPTSAEFDADAEGVRFRVSNRQKELVMSKKWLGQRTDLTEAEKESFVDWLDEQDYDSATTLATARWFANGTIRVPEDMPKVQQAMKVAQMAKVDATQFKSPMEVIDTFADIKPKEKAINPDDVKTLSNKVELPNGLAVYDVEESQESRENMRKIINTHFGEDANPWCLLQGDGKGNLTEGSEHMWNHYNKYPKRVAFKDGKLIAFFASADEPTWWDRQDASHSAIPYSYKENGKTIEAEYNEETGESEITKIYKGNKQNGLYVEWYPNGQMEYRVEYKDGKRDGLEEWWYQDGQIYSRAEFKVGKRDGLEETWYKNGQIQSHIEYKDGKQDGVSELWHENGQMRSHAEWKEGYQNGVSESWWENGRMQRHEEYGEMPNANIDYSNEDISYTQVEPKRVGVWERWEPNGVKVEQTKYENDKIAETKSWYNDGTLRYSRTQNGNQSITIERPNEFSDRIITTISEGNDSYRTTVSNDESSTVVKEHFVNGSLVEKDMSWIEFDFGLDDMGFYHETPMRRLTRIENNGVVEQEFVNGELVSTTRKPYESDDIFGSTRFSVGEEGGDYAPVWGENETMEDAINRLRNKKKVLEIEMRMLEREAERGRLLDAEELESVRRMYEKAKRDLLYASIGPLMPELAEGESETDASYQAKMEDYRRAKFAWQKKHDDEDAMMSRYVRDAIRDRKDLDEAEKARIAEICEACGIDVTARGAQKTTKNEIINRRIAIDEANYEDKLFFKDIESRTTPEQRAEIPFWLECSFGNPTTSKDSRYRDYLTATGKVDVAEKDETIDNVNAVYNAPITSDSEGLRLSDVIEYAIDNDAEIIFADNQLNGLIKFQNGDIYTLDKFGVQYAMHLQPEAWRNVMSQEDAELLAMFLRGEAEVVLPKGVRDYKERKELEANEVEVLKDIRNWFDFNYEMLEREGVLLQNRKIANYVTHIWDFKNSDAKAVAKFGNYVRMSTPYKKTRVFASLREGLEAGMKLKYNDILDVMADYGKKANEAVASKRLVDHLRHVEIDGKPIIRPTDEVKGDPSYIEISNDALIGMSVDVRIEGKLRAIFERQDKALDTDTLELDKAERKALKKIRKTILDDKNAYEANDEEYWKWDEEKVENMRELARAKVGEEIEAVNGWKIEGANNIIADSDDLRTVSLASQIRDIIKDGHKLLDIKVTEGKNEVGEDIVVEYTGVVGKINYKTKSVMALVTLRKTKDMAVLYDVEYIDLSQDVISGASKMDDTQQLRSYLTAVLNSHLAPQLSASQKADIALKWFDTISSFVKQTNLAASFFHHLALTESFVTSTILNPIQGAKWIAKQEILGAIKSARLSKGKYVSWIPEISMLSSVDRNEDLTRDAIKHLVQLGHTSSDFGYTDGKGMPDRWVEWLAKVRMREASMSTVRKFGAYLAEAAIIPSELFRALKNGMDAFLWDHIHNGHKLGFYSIGAKHLREVAKKEHWSEEKLERELRELGQLTNDQFGGQHWDVIGMNPKLLKGLQRGLLSPDWTASSMIRQPAAVFGYGQLYSNDESFWKTAITYIPMPDKIKRLNSKDKISYARKRYSHAMWFLGVPALWLIMNAMNTMARLKDEEDEKRKADERRKVDPTYKSAYELIYPDGMKWQDYTMLGNGLGHTSHLFTGRYSNGREQYIRWGKQFREVPELLMDKDGFHFPMPLLTKMVGKLNPVWNTLVTAVGGHSISGYENDIMKGTEGTNRDLAMFVMAANSTLPFAVQALLGTDKEFTAYDLAFPTHEGFKEWKAIKNFEVSLNAQDSILYRDTYKACVQNGVDAKKMFEVAKMKHEAEMSKIEIEGVETLQDAMEKYNASSNPSERKALEKRMQQESAAQDLKQAEWQEAQDMWEESQFVSEKQVSAYDMLRTAEDYLEEDRIRKRKAGLKKYADMKKELDDMTKDPFAHAQFEKDYGDSVRAYKQLVKIQSTITSLKKRLGEGKDAEVMAQIREVRKKAFTAKGQEYGKKKKAKAKKEKPAKPIADYGKELSWSESEE